MSLRRTTMLGVIAVSLAALAACTSGTNDTLNTAGKGRVAIVMSSSGAVVASSAIGTGLSRDALVAGGSGASVDSTAHHDCAQNLQAANVTFASVLARTLDGQLTAVTIELPVTVDMLSIATGKEATLPIGFLPPGTYDQIVVVMTQVSVTLADGTQVTITPPGGGWTAIVPVAQPFTVVEGQTTTITLNFRKDMSFACGFGGWEFHPEIESDGNHNDNDDNDD